jgi:PAS domain S-box-containing protein
MNLSDKFSAQIATVSQVIKHVIKKEKNEREIDPQSASKSRDYESFFYAIRDGLLDQLYILEAVEDESGELQDFKFVEVNDIAQQHSGLPEYEWKKRHLSDFFDADDDKGLFKRHFQVFRSKKPYEGEHYFPGDIGTAGWYFFQIMPSDSGLITLVRDITAKKSSESTIIQNEERYRKLVEGTADTVLQFDSFGRIIFANAAAGELAGLPKEQLIESSLYTYLHPRDAQKIREFVLDEGHNATGNLSLAARFEAKHGDGKTVLISINGELTSDQSKVFTAIGQDISEMKRVEDRLRASEDRFKALVANASEAIITVDALGIVQYANDAARKILGLSKIADLIDKNDEAFSR